MADAGMDGRPHDHAERAAALAPDYLATLIHEIRNPLAPMRTATELLRSLCTDPRQLQAVNIIERQIVALTHLLDDVLEAASARRSPFALTLKTVDVADFVEPALSAARISIETKRQSLFVALPPESVSMNCDAVRLSQVFQILLGNATRHTPEGGSIALKVDTAVDTLIIEVNDNGGGISADRLPAIFNVFVQSAQPKSLAHKSDYNLAIARNIVEMHGGTITAESAGIGHGSRFVVRLPIQPDRSQFRPNVSSLSPSRRVLIVDDHPDAAQSLAQVLARAGHSVATATSGELALELVERFTPEAVVIDIGLPGIDGFDVARQLKTKSATADALLIAVSGLSLKQFRDLESYAIFRHYLLKPTSAYTILHIIEHTLDEREQNGRSA